MISAFFADKRIKLLPAESYVFEYTISTTRKDESCIVALQTADPKERIVDQNGLENSPDTDITELSLNKWYERKFIIKRSQLPSNGSIRIALTCASAGGRKVEVYINSIKLGRSGQNKPDFVLFDPKTMCPACKGSAPVPSAKCVPNDQTSSPIWVIDGDVRQQNMTLGDVTIFNGDVYADQLDVANVTAARLSGCLYPLQQKSIEFIVSPLSAVVMIFHGRDCPTPKVSVKSKYERDERCEYKLIPASVRVVESTLFYSVHYAFDIKCQAPDRRSSSVEQTESNQMLGLVLLIVTIGVGATLGVSIYVVRRHRQKKIVAKFHQIRPDSHEDITL